MAEIARDYHNDLQTDDSEMDPGAKSIAITDALDGMSSHENDPKMQQLRTKLTEEDVITALLQSSSGTSAGINGIPTEFWKKLHEVYLETTRTNDKSDEPPQPTFNIIKVLTAVYNSIEEDGIVAGTQFA
ncbi:hypothetical protein C8R43DRAFT_821231, partial [Mycena crocata]